MTSQMQPGLQHSSVAHIPLWFADARLLTVVAFTDCRRPHADLHSISMRSTQVLLALASRVVPTPCAGRSVAERTVRPMTTTPWLGPKAWLSAEAFRSCGPSLPLCRPSSSPAASDAARSWRGPLLLAGQQTVVLRTWMRPTLEPCSTRS